MKKIFLLLALIATSFSFAQTGYVNAEYLLSIMPEAKTADTELTSYGQTLSQDIAKAKSNANAQFQNLQQQAGAEGVTEEQLKSLSDRAKEIETALAQESQSAEIKLAKKRAELLQPLYDKINNAIDKVAKEKSFKLIVSIEAVMFAEEGLDITEAVKKELGL